MIFFELPENKALFNNYPPGLILNFIFRICLV